jgi:predicted TPR repeat methyltransferase
VAPDHPDVLHFAGVLAHQRGQNGEALALIERSLMLEPDRADWHSNLGNILKGLGRLDEAAAAYERAIALEPDHANAQSNLGVLLRALGKPEDAEAAYRTAIRLDPNHIDAHTNLGVLLNGQGRTEEAVACFCRVITLRPKHPDARRLLALAHCTVGEVEKAVQIYEEWLAEEPENPVAMHMLAACSGREVPTRASDGFVEYIFDNFAASFDSKLARLSYRAPALVAAMVEASERPAAKSLNVLDAGCGTGLCGPLLAPFARRLTGVDLSAGMLAQARERNVYDELAKSELTAYLNEHSEAFDLIVSADTLVYFGALDDVVVAATRALRPGGSLVFTLEAAEGDRATNTYTLQTHGRYAHSRAYVERLLSADKLKSEINDAELRLEAGTPVRGLVIRATRPGMRVAVSSIDEDVTTCPEAGQLVGEHRG